MPLRGKGGYYVGGYGFATAYGVNAFVGFGFEVNFFGGDAEGFGEGFAHFGEMRAELWSFEDNDGVDVFDAKMFFVEEFAGVLEELKAIGALPLGVGVGKMCPDVAQTRRAEERVAERVGYDIAIGMADGALVKGDFDAADDQLASFGEAMQIVADAAADAHAFFLVRAK